MILTLYISSYIRIVIVFLVHDIMHTQYKGSKEKCCICIVSRTKRAITVTIITYCHGSTSDLLVGTAGQGFGWCDSSFTLQSESHQCDCHWCSEWGCCEMDDWGPDFEEPCKKKKKSTAFQNSQSTTRFALVSSFARQDD